MNTFHPRSSWPQPSERRLSSTASKAAVGSSFVDEASQMTVVVLENVSMVFHRPFGDDEPDDEISYAYSLEAPSYLGEPSSSSRPPQRLNSTDYAANHNISQYFRVEQQQQPDADDEARADVDDFNDNDTVSEEQQQQQQPTEEEGMTSNRKDSILGELPVLLRSAEVGAPPHDESVVAHQAYTDKLLGLEDHDYDEMDSTTKTASMDSSSTSMDLGYESKQRQQKKTTNTVSRWFKQLGKNSHHKDKKKSKKSSNNNQEKKKKHHIGNPFKRSVRRSAPRKALPKRSVSDLRRASF